MKSERWGYRDELGTVYIRVDDRKSRFRWWYRGYGWTPAGKDTSLWSDRMIEISPLRALLLIGNDFFLKF